jgi:hypothetical protein
MPASPDRVSASLRPVAKSVKLALTSDDRIVVLGVKEFVTVKTPLPL